MGHLVGITLSRCVQKAYLRLVGLGRIQGERGVVTIQGEGCDALGTIVRGCAHDVNTSRDAGLVARTHAEVSLLPLLQAQIEVEQGIGVQLKVQKPLGVAPDAYGSAHACNGIRRVQGVHHTLCVSIPDFP